MTKNPYDFYQETEQPKKDLYSVFLEITEEKKAALKSAIYESTPIPPEAATKQYQLSRQTSLPVNVVRAKENEIKKMTEIQSFDYEDLVNNFPQTALQLSDPNKTAAIKDDVDSLTYFERIIANTKQEFKANLAGGMTTNLRLKKMIADTRGESLSNKEENELALYYQGQGDQVDYKLGLFKNEAQELLAKAPALTIGQLPSIAQGLGYAAPAAAGGFAIAGPAGATVAGGAAGFLGSSKRITADAYDEFRNFTDENGEKIEPKVAAGAALLTGGVGGFLEFLSIGKAVKPFKGLFTKESAEQLLKTSAGREALKNIAGMALVEGGTEASQELSNIIFGEAAKLTSEKEFKPFGVKKDKVTPEAVAKYLTSKPVTERVGEAGVAGFVGGTGFGVFSSGVNYANQRYQARKKQEEEKKIIDDVVKKTSESKVYQRDPELFKEVTKDTLGSQNVYFPAEEVATYFQDKPDQLNQFFNASPSAREQLDEARQIGGNIIIPGNEAADILNREPELRKYASLSPEGYVESLLQDSAIDDSIRIQDLADEQVKTKKELNQVQKNIESRILNLGMPYRDAKDIIALTNAFYETQSQRVGSKEAQKILDTYLGQLETERQVAPKAPAMPRIEDLDLLLDKARKETKIKNKKPVLKFLREKGVKPDSNLAGELKAIGINPKTAPGLFKKSGIGDVDNFPLSEVQARFPNIQIPADETGNYADRQAILDLIAQEQSGVDISRTETETSQFAKQLDELGIDLNASNEEIKKAIKEYQGRTFNQIDETSLIKQGFTEKAYAGTRGEIPNKIIGYRESFKGGENYFGGIFASGDIEVAESHGDNIQEFLYKPESYVSDNEFRNIDYLEILKDVVAKKLGEKLTQEELEDLSEFVSGEKSIYSDEFIEGNERLAEIVSYSDYGEIDWALQGLKGEVARRLGYSVVGIRDEHGESLLILGGDGVVFLNPKTYFQTQDQTKTPAFKKWFGDSKVVDDKGEPLVVYHGTDKEFTKFDKNKTIGGQFWFTNRKDLIEKGEVGAAGKGRIVEAYLSIKNPASWDEYEKFTLDELISRGYDGIILEEKDQNTYVAFEPTQIKSAENRGTFDPNNPNIYYQSTSSLNQKALQEDNYTSNLDKFTPILYRQTSLNKALELLPYTNITTNLANDRLFFANTKDLAIGQESNKNGIIIGFDSKLIKGQLNKKPGWEVLYKNNQAEFLSKFTDQKNYQESVISIEIPKTLQGQPSDLKKLKSILKNLKTDGWTKTETDNSIIYNKPNIYQQDIKGQTQFIGQKPVITLFEKADRSTLLHELGHVFLQTQADIAKLENVAPEFKKDWTTLENWLGVKDGVITREAHEKFARGFEAYLREGKAPSIGLRDAFRRFKNWLLRIYQDVMQLNVELNDDIRDVFDRMLATKEAIDAQKNNPLYRADDDVMELLTKKEKEDYLKITQNAGAKAEEKLLVKALKQKTIENKEFYRNELKQVKKEIREELDQDKTYRVLTFLKTGKIPGTEGEATPLKLSRQDVKDNYDGEFLKYLPNEIFGKDGVEVSLIADEFGFKSGSEMLYAIANAPDYKKEVSRLAKEEMIRRYGDMLYDGTIEQEALEASQNEARANKILYELNAAGRKINSLKESKDAYKQKASDILSKKALRDIDVNSFYLAEIKAAKEAGKYLAKKDYKKAVEAKKKQLLNHYLFRESKLLKDEIQKSLKRYAKYKKKPVKGKVRLEEDYREKIVGLLQDFGLAKKGEEYQQTNIQELESWKKEKQNEGVLGLVEFPEIADFQGKSFNQLTVNEYRTLDDAIENLAHVGESLRFIEVNGKKVELDSIASKIDESIRSHLEPKKVIRGTLTPKEKLIDAFDQFVMPLIKAKALVKELDGKDRGTLYKSFIDPVADAELVRNDMTKEAVDKFNSIVQKYFPKGFPKKRQYFASVNAEYNKESILAFALNWGTETNKKRIRDGFNYSDAQVLDMLSTLTKDELQFVQEMWDFIGSYWERISNLQKKLIGFAPRKEKASPVTIKSADGQDVSLKGGYYPLSYTEESNLKSDSAAQFGTINPRMEFEKSFTKERTEKRVNKEVTLTLIPAINHIADVVNDLAMKEQAWNSDKILNHPKVKKAIIDTKGIQTFKQLKFWLEDLFGTATNSAGAFGKAINYLRAGTTISQMGLKIATTVMQISGYPQSIVKIGVKPMAKGFLKFIGNGNPLEINKNYQMALEKSKILKSRATSFHQDIYDTLRIMEGKGKIARNSTSIYFYPMAKMQMMVDVPTWWGAYYKGLDKFKEESEAVKYADQMVVQAQGSGLLQDLSAFERGSVGGLRKSNLIKIFTAFYTYMNAKLNLAYESYQGTDFKKPRDVAKFASDMMLLYFVEAFLGQLLVRKVPDLEDDEESATLYTASLMAQNFFGQFPIGREAVSAAQGFDATPAGLTGIENIVKGISYAGKELTEEEPDMTKIIEGINQSGGILFHYPSGQVDVFIDALQKAQEGEDVAPIDYLIRQKK